MKKNFSLIFLFLLIFLYFSTACDQRRTEEKTGEILLATSIFPVADIIRNISRGVPGIQVMQLIPTGANPHSFEPDPSLVKKMKKAQLFFIVHPKLDQWLLKFVPQEKRIFLSEKKSEEKNPHIWLHLPTTVKMIAKIEKQLIFHFPKKKNIFSENALAYRKKIQDLHEKFKEEFQSCAGMKLFQWHPAWAEFTADYGLKIRGTMQQGHGDKPSIRKIRNLVKIARDEKVKFIIVGLNSYAKEAQILQREIDGELVYLDSLGGEKKSERNSYLKLMTYNGEKLLSLCRKK